MAKHACPCNDFSRTGFLRAAAAQAGEGLPEIEPGMPIPAGTGLSRRTFLARSAGLALAVYGGNWLGSRAIGDGIASAAAAGPTAPVLVSVFLEGGIDSLSVLYPAADSRYYSLRPKLALPASAGPAFSEDSRLHWHPSTASLATLHAEGKIAVLPGIGYDHPDKSHFTSRHYWEVGATDPHLRTGWLGRFLDATGAADNPLQGLSLDNRLQPALATARMPVASIDGPDRYAFSPPKYGKFPLEDQMLDAVAQLGAAHSKAKDPALRQAGEAAAQAHRLRGRLQPFTSGISSPVPYPEAQRDDFPRRLAGLAAMLSAGLPLRCVAMRAPGMYDTHSDQADDLSEGLKLTADSLLAFQRDLESRGLADRVLVHVWSEFGRRVQENGSLGTDHGAAGIGFLIGSRVHGRMIGEFPGLDRLDEQGNLRATADFRAVYAAIFEQWFGTDAGRVIPNAGSFARPTLLR
jgi:uncharacterized protein (DUF1501 family)